MSWQKERREIENDASHFCVIKCTFTVLHFKAREEVDERQEVLRDLGMKFSFIRYQSSSV